jgi:hypothetical protein
MVLFFGLDYLVMCWEVSLSFQLYKLVNIYIDVDFNIRQGYVFYLKSLKLIRSRSKHFPSLFY